MSSHQFSVLYRQATSFLCVVLMLNLSIMSSGCGVSPGEAIPIGLQSVIPLSPDHPLAAALRGTAFDGATALEVDPSSGAFRLIFPDAGRSLTGRMVVRDGAWEMTEFNFSSDGLAAAMKLDPATRQVVAIETSYGHYWEPTKEERLVTRPRAAGELDVYIAANDALLAVTAPGNAKSSSSLVILIPIAAFIMIIWALCANGVLILCPGFPILFGVIIALLNAMPPPGGGQPIPENNPPVAQDDAFTTPENTVLNGNVLSNNGSGADSDPDGGPLSTTLLTGTTNGTVNLQTNGSFAYTPNTDFEGTDTFTYTLSDGQGGTDTATAAITVTRVNQPPDARDDFFPNFFPGFTDTAEPRGKGGLNILMGNVFDDNGSGPDSDPDGDTFMVVAVEGSAANVGVPTMLATGGVVTVMPDGSFEFFTEDDDFLDETFTYTIADPGGLTDTATVTIDIVD